MKVRNRLYREERHIQLLRAAGVGLLAGGIAVLYQLSVSRAESFGVMAAAWFQRMGPIGAVLFIGLTA